jgi:phosphate transport system substrate-binding protein
MAKNTLLLKSLPLIAASVVLAGSGCGPGGEGRTGGAATGESLSGTIEIDGSSTVAPIVAAVAEEFGQGRRNVRIPLGVSGTGGGMKRFVAGEVDIVNASRPITEEELAGLRNSNIEFVEIPVAYDGLSVVVNPQNDFVDHLTVAELQKIWRPDSPAQTWADVRAGWPAEKIRLYGPGTDSGTFEYFTEAIVGKKNASRSDYQASEDDHTLVQGVSGDRYGLGYFGYAYYEENQQRLKLVPIDGGRGPMLATRETIENGTYAPLSRPLFVYVKRESLERPEVREFLMFMLRDSREVVEQVGYVPLPQEGVDLGLQRIQERQTGSTFLGAEPGMTIGDLMRRERRQ